MIAFPQPQGAAGGQHPAGGQRGVSGGAEVPEDPAGGGARAGPGVQALPAQHHRSLHGAGLPRGGRGQSVARSCAALGNESCSLLTESLSPSTAVLARRQGGDV